MRARTHTPSAAAEATVSFDSKTKAVRKRQDPSQHEICAFAIIGFEARQSRSTGSWLDDRDEQIDGRCHAGFIPETWTLSASLTVPMSLTHRHPHTQERHCLLKRSSLPDSLFSESILLEATQRTACQVDLDSTVSLSLSFFCFQPRSLAPSLLPPPHMLTLTTDLAVLVSPRRRQRQSSSSSAKRRRWSCNAAEWLQKTTSVSFPHRRLRGKDAKTHTQMHTHSGELT